MSRVAELGCIVCSECGYGEGTPAQLHHPRIEVGGAQRESDWLVLPLCPEHHTGKTGVHGMGRANFYLHYGVTEVDLLAAVTARLNA
jgi:hypothetical protein